MSATCDTPTNVTLNAPNMMLGVDVKLKLITMQKVYTENHFFSKYYWYFLEIKEE